MKKRLALFLGALGLMLTGLTAINCDSVDEAFDCQAVCSRYQECYQADYNVDTCRSNCRTRASNDATVKQAADTCEACIGDKSCLSATFTCGASCGQIVP